MLGLSIGTDSGVPKLGRNNHKSYNFAASNIGRFHTSGVSGSMKKHTAKKTKEKLGDTDKNNLVDDQDEKLRQLKDRSKNYVPERLEARQKEIEEDTMKLLALEKKLDEVKRQKELKRRRDEARALQRLEYSSVLKIQRRVRRWLLRRHMRAATALQAFLKFAAAKQAVAAATWAIATLREFVQMIEIKQMRYNELKEAARSAAVSLWSHVEKKSAAGVMEARKQAVFVASRTIQIGIRTAALQKQHKKRTKKISMFASSPKGIGSPKARAAKLWALLRKRVVPVHFKFHDTAYRRRTVFTDGYVNPAKDIDHPNYKGTGKLSMAEVCIQVAERKKRSKMEEVMRLHKQREEAMAQERVLRLQMIEEDKKKRELEQTKHDQQQFLKKAMKEKSKVDFLRRVETEQIERAKVVNQAREKREKARREREAQEKRELENEAQETKLMYAEDVRFFHNLEKVRKQRLKDYATKRKCEMDKVEKDHQPGPSQMASGPGYLSARGAGGGGERAHEGMTQHELALEEERKMHVWAAHDNAMKQRLAARRAAEKEEKRNAELEQEMIRKEKELVAMKAQLMLKRASFMKAKAKKLKDQAQENSKKSDQDGDNHGSTSARTRSRGGSRGGHRKKSTGRGGSGSAPSTAQNSPSKKKKETIYDVSDPLALDMLPSGPRYEPPGEDWDWHTPRAVGSGKSAISDLRRNKCSPILPKHATQKEGGGPLVSPGGVRLNSAERLAMAIRRDQAQQAHAPHPYDQHDDEVILQSSPFKSCSVHELRASAQKKLPLSPIELEKELLRDSVKFPAIAQAASEGVLGEGLINKKEKKVASKGVLKNKYINEKLENSPYGSLLPKQSQAQSSKVKHQPQQPRPTPQPDSNAGNDPYRAPQTVVAPTSTFTALNRPARPSLQGISIINAANASVKKSVKGESLVDIIQKAREKLRQDSNIQEEKDETSAALIAATAALGGGNHLHPNDDVADIGPDDQPTINNKKPKVKKKFKKVKKKVTPPPAVEKEKPLEPNKEKVNKRKLIHDTYNKIMKAELTKKNAEKKSAENAEADIEVPPEVVADFFAKRRQDASNKDNDDEKTSRQPSVEENKTITSLSYWTSVVGGGADVSSPRRENQSKKKGKAHSKSPKKSMISQQLTPQRQSLKDKENLTTAQDQGKAGEQVDNRQHFLLDEQHLQLNSSPYEEQQAQKERQEMIEQLRQEQLLQQHQDMTQDAPRDDYEDEHFYDEDFEDAEVAENKPVDLAIGLNTGFRESESYGEAYEEELNMECERLRAELEKKMLAKFDL